MERRVLKILHEAFGDFQGIPGIYFIGDTTKKIKKKSFSRTTYTPPEELFPAGMIPARNRSRHEKDEGCTTKRSAA
jgi:hypothetical protein